MSLKKWQFFGHILLFYSTANQSSPAFQCPSTLPDTKQPCYTGGWKAVCGKRAVFDKLSTKNFLSQCQKQGQSSLNSYIYKAIIWMLIKNLNFKFATFLCLIHIQLLLIIIALFIFAIARCKGQPLWLVVYFYDILQINIFKVMTDDK